MSDNRLAVLGIFLVDSVVIFFSVLITYLLRFNFSIPSTQIYGLITLLLFTLPVRIASFWYQNVYRSLSRYLSVRDLGRIIKGLAVSQILIVAMVLSIHYENFPRTVLIIEPIIALFLVGGVRFSIRMLREYKQFVTSKAEPNLPKLLIYGAGDLAETVYRSIRSSNPAQYNIVGFLDDDRRKWHRYIHGLPIFGGRKKMNEVIEKHNVDVIVIAINHARASLIKDLMDLYAHEANHRKVAFQIVPAVSEYLKSVAQRKPGFRRIELADLLPRKQSRLDLNAISNVIEGKTILVTGAGGTIGSELCRQLARLRPQTLLMLEKNNTGLFYIDKSLAPYGDRINIRSISGDVQDRNLLENIFQTYRPHVVFHAAAHKHVPLMETNPQEAIKNNTIATWLLAETAVKYNVEKFLFISTDKAVHPCNVMGASKRLGEMIVRSMRGLGTTCFMSVRFGNVLGSSGSVVEIFQDQIAGGGPLTVTHPEMTRYFMTTEEAVQLILQACVLSKGGEIFVLNMGTPVKVVDLARNFIVLNGLEPDKDIHIEFTGIRPGEKLHEELFTPSEVRTDTGHPDIFMAVPEEANVSLFTEQLTELRELSALADPQLLLEKIKEIIPSFSGVTPAKKDNSVVSSSLN